MKVDTKNWVDFRIGDYFDIRPTKAYPEMNNKDLDDGGETPFVVNSGVNNGIGGYSTLAPVEKGNIITFSDTTDSNTFFYQPDPFIGFAHVQGMHPKGTFLNNLTALFLIQMIRTRTAGMFNYGRKMRRDIISETLIRLPAAPDGEPDWQWMEDYVKSLHHEPIKTANNSSQLDIDRKEWDWFKFGNLIDEIYKAESHSKTDLYGVSDFPKEGYVPFVTRTEENNAVDCYVDAKEVKVEDGNALVIGDTTSTVSYQPKHFSTGDHIVVIRASWLNEITGLFLVALLQRERFRYSYGRAFVMDSIKDTSIKLPITSTGEPDWEWMEKYMKSLPYGDRIG